MKGNKKVVLVVDDDMGVLKSYANFLGTYDVEPILVNTSARALILLDERVSEIDLIVLDGMASSHPDGPWLARQMRTHGYKGKMLAASSDERMNNLMMEAGCDERADKQDALIVIPGMLGLEH